MSQNKKKRKNGFALFRSLCILCLFFACTKDISLTTEVEFELIEQHQETGFVNQPLSSTFTVVPEEVLENYTYSLSYDLKSGDGGYLTLDGVAVAQGEKFAMTGLSSSLAYQGSQVGPHDVTVTATDNFGFTEKVDITYVLNNVPANWTATGSADQVQMGTSTAITLVLSTDASIPDITFERNYVLASGEGTLSDASDQPLALNDFAPIAPGTYALTFTPDQLGTVILRFVLRDSNGQELTDEVTFEVVTEVVDDAPPVLTILGDNPLELIQNTAYIDHGATAMDAVDGNLTSQIIVDDSNVNTTTLGMYEVTYTVTDNAMNTATSIRTVNVVEDSDGNQPPTAVNDSRTTQPGMTISFDPRLNDTDPENDALTIIGATQPTQANTGTVTFNGQSLTFSPAAGFTGVASFEYTINDGNIGNDATGTVAITVSSAANQAPTAVDDDSTTQQGAVIVFDPRTNDSDPENDPLIISAVGPVGPANAGTATFDGQSVTFAPSPGFTGNASFTYTINDGNMGNDATATITITVTAATNQAPTAINDNTSTQQATPVSLDPRMNDTDPENDALTIIGTGTVSPANSGTATFTGTVVEFTPSMSFTGDANFTYTINDGNPGNDATAMITVSVTATANQAPTAVQDNITTPQGTAITYDPRVNDTDPENDALAITAVGPVTPIDSGNVTFTGTSITYTPEPGFTGFMGFTYTINDGTPGNDSNNTIFVEVTAAANQAPTAVDDVETTPSETVVIFDPRMNDTDPENDALSITAVGSVSPINAGTVSFTASSVSFTPANGFLGDAQFQYTINDGTPGNDASATITVTVDNQAPMAVNDGFTTPENVVLINNNVLLDNGNGPDTDPEGLPITVDQVAGDVANVGTAITGTGGGRFTILANGNITFDPNGDFDGLNDGQQGTTTITYRINDGTDFSNSATVTVTVTGVSVSISTWDESTGILTGPPGENVTITINSGGDGAGTSSLSAYNDQTFMSLIIDGNLATSWDTNGSGSDTSTFVMPASGIAYFQGSHVPVTGSSNGTSYTIVTIDDSFGGGMMSGSPIPD